ncbi:hypothetical protein ASF21_01245 [Arthrobacter sp. Leaf234]|uniref:hypothetical protein n=1 Tax=Arthrobacter sp. Leaf234 TaxID=1736303 RepID=UPI0006FB1B1C|nr:hypothetical protein [Arthrobacter sp. Leaf234]KQO03002.1 hypothetical protein ASF21_01245 [Arthrobacter sp. Leaf234]
MSNTTPRAFLALFIGLFIAGAALVLSLPAVFGPHEHYQAWLAMILGGVTAVLAVAVILMRPPRRGVNH